MNDPASLRKRIAELEQENKSLRDTSSSGGKNFNTMGRPGTMGQDKDWMSFGGGGPLERPTTANSQNQRVREV